MTTAQLLDRKQFIENEIRRWRKSLDVVIELVQADRSAPECDGKCIWKSAGGITICTKCGADDWG